MAYYAFVDSKNKVVSVISGRDEDEVVEGISDWEAYYSSKRPGLTALRTSCNTFGGVHYDPETREPSSDQSKALRFNFAGLGYIFDPDKGTDGAFIPPQPGPDWVLDEETCVWVETSGT
jgi:hypothetical protein